MAVDDSCIVRLAWTLWAPFDLLWCWFRQSAVDRDIEAQRRDLDRLAAETAEKIETTDDDLLGGPQ